MTNLKKGVLDHATCTYRTKNNAYAALATCMGLNALREFTLEEEPARRLLGLDRAVDVMVFGDESRLIEAFIVPEVTPCPGPNHLCLVLADLPSVLRRCEEYGFDVRTARVRDHDVHFVQDIDGNLFELKQAS
jgi:hypothetical protein